MINVAEGNHHRRLDFQLRLPMLNFSPHKTRKYFSYREWCLQYITKYYRVLRNKIHWKSSMIIKINVLMTKINTLTRWRTSYKIFIFEFNINECQFRLANKIVKPKNILSILRRKLDTYEGCINIRNGRYNENGESNQAWIKYLYIIQQRRIQCKMYFEKG